jgi:hypothetical protein
VATGIEVELEVVAHKQIKTIIESGYVSARHVSIKLYDPSEGVGEIV